MQCDICKGIFEENEIITVQGIHACIQCKPILIQQLKEGIDIAGRKLFRDKKSIITGMEATFPAKCIKCNHPIIAKWYKKTLYWHSPFFYLLILLNLLIYAVIALIVRRKVVVEFGLCKKHVTERRWALFLAVLFDVGGVVVLIGGAANESVVVIIAGIGLLIAGIVLGLTKARLLVPKKIEKERAYIVGACSDFLQELPEFEK